MWSPYCTTESILTSLINHSSWELHVSTTMPSMPAKKTKTKNKILDDRYYGSTAHDQCPGSILNYYRPVPWVNAQQVRRPSHSSGFTRRQSNTGQLLASILKLHTRFSALGGSLFFKQIELKTKTNPNGHRVVTVWVRFGFQLGLRQWEALIIMDYDYGTN